MRRIVLLTVATTLMAWLLVMPAAPASAECRIDTTIGAGDGEAVGRGVLLCDKDPDKPRDDPNPPVEHSPSDDSPDDNSLEGLDPELRAQIEKCLQENPSDLCYEGLVSGIDIPAVAREVVARLHLPDPTPQFGPDPDANQWHMLAVGYPLWLWTSGPTRLTTTVTRYGVSFTLTATWQDTRFELGDGHSLTCANTTPYPTDAAPGAPSPTCGYTYQKAAPSSGYRVQAHTNWRVDWSAAGHSGTLDTTYTGSRTVQVGELNALIVR